MTDYSPSNGRDNIIPQFYMKAVRNEFLTEVEGREIWEDKEYVEMIVPGDKNAIVHERVKQAHKDRWPNQYRAFVESRESPSEGTPLEEWAAVSASQVMELKSCHVRTVEALAGLSDTQLAKTVPMGGHALREKAQRFIEGQSAADVRIAELQAQVAALIAAQEAPKVVDTEAVQ